MKVHSTSDSPPQAEPPSSSDAATNSPSTPAEIPGQTSTAPNGPPLGPVAAKWHQWVRPVDFVLILLVFATAFLAASTTARNSDQWYHYAAGRQLVMSPTSFGSDPLSFVERTWVNHSWLYDIPSYFLIKADPTGAAVVAVKAVLFAAAFVVVFLLRKPGESLWPWLLAITLGVIAAVPHAGLRPLTTSVTFLAVTLYLVLGHSWKAGTSLPTIIMLGVMGWLWASVDEWFILGPLVVLLVLLGEWVNAQLLGVVNGPSLKELAKALGVILLACTLTPNHVRVWELPTELGFGLPANYQTDRELSRLTLSPTNLQEYVYSPVAGSTLNGGAFAILLVLGGGLLAFGTRDLTATHILLWVAFAGLSLVHYRLIMYFAIVAVPIVALAITSLTSRIELGNVGDVKTQSLLLLASIGRLLAIPAVLVMVAGTYPGWLLPSGNDPVYAARLNWSVNYDQGHRRTAELLQRWQERGQLPADFRGVTTNLDLANHIAWFAPNVRMFANGRYKHHAAEISTLIPARKILTNREKPIEPRELDELGDMLKAHSLNYLAYSSFGVVPNATPLLPLAQLTARADRYNLWHVDGRVAILGDLQAKQYDATAYQVLSFNPIRLALNSEDVQPLPEVPPLAPPRKPSGSFLEAFLVDPPKPRPVESLDAGVWHSLSQLTQNADQQNRIMAWPNIAGAVGNPLVASEAQRISYQPPDVAMAYDLLAARAALRAVALMPDDADGHASVAMALGQESTLQGTPPPEKATATIIGIRRYLDRIDPPAAVNRGLAETIFKMHMQLAQLYANVGNSPEMAARTLSAAKPFMPYAFRLDDETQLKDKIKRLDEMIGQYEKTAGQANDQLERAIASGKPTQAQILYAAHSLGLLNRAIEQYQQMREKEELGTSALPATIVAADAYFRIGRIDEADFFLREAINGLEELAKEKKQPPPEMGLIRVNIPQLRYRILLHSGNYAAIGQLMEQTQIPTFTNEQKTLLQELVAAKDLNSWELHRERHFALGSTIAGTPTGVIVQSMVEYTMGQYQEQYTFFIQRALQLMIEGKPLEAETRFKQSLAPQGISLPSYLPERQLAERYLKMIEQARK